MLSQQTLLTGGVRHEAPQLLYAFFSLWFLAGCCADMQDKGTVTGAVKSNAKNKGHGALCHQSQR